MRDEGQPLVYTSQAVRPGMRVEEEPEPGPPRIVLEQVLAPHGLDVLEDPSGVLVVVAVGATAGKGDPAANGPAALEGWVLDADGRPLPEARVTIGGPQAEAVPSRPAGPDGAFSVGGFPPGLYTVEARAPGHLAQRLENVPLEPPAVRRHVFLLPRRPLLHDRIEVRPSRLTLLGERPASSVSWGRREVEELPHLGDDLFRAASLLPGTAGNDVSAALSVRGGRRDELRVVLDGQELYEAFHLPDYDRALSVIDAHTIAEASLSTGNFPVRHGDRMGGVLELHSLDPRALGASPRHLLALSALHALAATAGADDRGRLYWLAALRRGGLDVAGKVIGDDDPLFWDGLVKVGTDLADGSWTAHLLATGDVLDLDKSEEDGFEVVRNDYRSTYGWLHHQTAPTSALLVESRLGASRLAADRSGRAVEEEGGYRLRDRRRLSVAEAGQEATWVHGAESAGTLAAGWHWRRFEAPFDYLKAIDRELVILPPAGTPTVLPADDEVSLRHRVDSRDLGLWASERWRGGRWSAEAGLRVDRVAVAGGAPADETLLSPRLHLARHLGERTLLHAAWGRFVQSQRPYELQVERGDTEPGRAERSTHALLGIEVAGPPGGRLEAVRLELYRRRVADPRPRLANLLEPLNYFPEIEPDRVLVSAEESRFRGVELTVRGHHRRLRGWLAYAWSQAEDRLPGGKVPRPLDARHAASLHLAHPLPGDWELSLAWRYHTGWPTTAVEAVRLPPSADDGEEGAADEADGDLAARFLRPYGRRLPPYHRLDLRLSRRWQRPGGAVTLYLDVQNLYDRRNRAGFDVELDDEAGEVVLEPEEWPGIFPSLGVTWEL